VLSPISHLREELHDLARWIHNVADNLESEVAREELDEINGALRGLILATFGPKPRAAPGQGARSKILDLLQARVGDWVSGDELREVSGIQEWARRVRELRVQDGYDIEESAGRYRLREPAADAESAATWRSANEIRRRPGSAKDRILAFLIARVGEVVTRDDLDYVARIKEGSRRVRELRDEDGWPVESHIDVAYFQPGQYRLISDDPQDRRDKRQRIYPEGLRALVFERDRFTCQQCGRDRAHAEASGDARFYLEVHHLTAVAEQLDALPAEKLNNPDNLVTYCHACHLRETSEFQKRRRRERRER
jgi:biotin operon repressor